MSRAEPAGEQPPQRYVTEIYEGSREPPELHVLHKQAMTEPDMKAEAAQLAGRDPRPISTQERNQPCQQLPHGRPPAPS